MVGFIRDGGLVYGRPVRALPVVTRDTAGVGDSFHTDGHHTLGLTLRVVSVSGLSPSLTVTIEHSEDEATWRDHTSFSAMSTTGTQRLVVSGLDHFWRVAWDLSETIEFGLAGFIR